jgi:2-amino-4-hydroxy-6-hydroxymethyldihydropteridine diphosphokinase
VRIYKYFLGIGSNIEPRLVNLKNAVSELNKYGITRNKSSVYESEPWGYKEQATFYNAVIKYESELSPIELLIKIKSTEQVMGREESKQWGPRQIDIDILLCDNLLIRKTNLQVPHKYLKQRRFVLEPLAELTESIILQGQEQKTDMLIQMCSDKSTVNKLKLDW